MKPSVPRVGIPWATAAVSVAAAAVVFGIVVGPVERALSPPATPPISVVAETTAGPVSPAAMPAPAAPAPRDVQHVATALPSVPEQFGPADRRRVTSTSSAARGRISRARARVTVPVQYPDAIEPQIALPAEIDAEWSPSALPAVAAAAAEPPAALPEVVAPPRADVQAP